jgi:hypothetical protein
MGSIKFHEIWLEQCKAAHDIKFRYGLNAAFDYIVSEKLVDYMAAAAGHPEFARELPRFVSAVRQMFSFEEMRAQIARVEREQQTASARAEASSSETNEDDDLSLEDPTASAERRRPFDIIKDLLTAPALGTS